MKHFFVCACETCPPPPPACRKFLSGIAAFIFLFTAQLDAGELTASDSASSDYFGNSVSASGSAGLIGASGNDDAGSSSGSAYLFRGLGGTTGAITETAKLTASDATAGDNFGTSVSISGSTGLIGARRDHTGGLSDTGSAYVFRGLDTATGNITESAKLTASDAAASDTFGGSVSLSGTIGLVGASEDDDGGNGSGSAYVFRNLDTATGDITENVKLTASDAAADDDFGYHVSLSGTIGLVGAYGNDDAGSDSGSAYIFRDLDTATGTITENAKLIASDAAAGDDFGTSVSISGTMGLVGAEQDTVGGTKTGSTYLYRDLDTATGTVTEQAKLIASDGAASDYFGYSVSISGTTGLVGADGDDASVSNAGSAYFYFDLDTATGNVNEAIKVTASVEVANDYFGNSVSLSGNNFIIGTNKEKSYTGTVSSLSTVNAGSANEVIRGISFVSKRHWVIGETTDSNRLTLSSGDSADVSAANQSVFVGRNAGSDNNTLVLEGSLKANNIYVGSVDGNTGNTLQIETGATFDLSDIFLAWDNRLIIEGDYSDSTTLFAFFDDTKLQVETEAGGTYVLATIANANTAWRAVFNSGYTTIFAGAVPEPSTYALITGLILAGVVAYKKRKA